MPNRLPSSTPLANASDDSRVQEGLIQIAQLDERLMQKSVEAAMVARETFPDTWSASDKKQAERDQNLLLASLDRCLFLLCLPSPPLFQAVQTAMQGSNIWSPFCDQGFSNESVFKSIAIDLIC